MGIIGFLGSVIGYRGSSWGVNLGETSVYNGRIAFYGVLCSLNSWRFFSWLDNAHCGGEWSAIGKHGSFKIGN
jgi:hypothetical protein